VCMCVIVGFAFVSCHTNVFRSGCGLCARWNCSEPEAQVSECVQDSMFGLVISLMQVFRST
jgi:hypothetical protein